MESLPGSCLSLIFSFLTQADLINNVSRTCRHLRDSVPRFSLSVAPSAAARLPDTSILALVCHKQAALVDISQPEARLLSLAPLPGKNVRRADIQWIGDTRVGMLLESQLTLFSVTPDGRLVDRTKVGRCKVRAWCGMPPDAVLVVHRQGRRATVQKLEPARPWRSTAQFEVEDPGSDRLGVCFDSKAQRGVFSCFNELIIFDCDLKILSRVPRQHIREVFAVALYGDTVEHHSNSGKTVLFSAQTGEIIGRSKMLRSESPQLAVQLQDLTILYSPGEVTFEDVHGDVLSKLSGTLRVPPRLVSFGDTVGILRASKMVVFRQKNYLNSLDFGSIPETIFFLNEELILYKPHGSYRIIEVSSGSSLATFAPHNNQVDFNVHFCAWIEIRNDHHVALGIFDLKSRKTQTLLHVSNPYGATLVLSTSSRFLAVSGRYESRVFDLTLGCETFTVHDSLRLSNHAPVHEKTVSSRSRLYSPDFQPLSEPFEEAIMAARGTYVATPRGVYDSGRGSCPLKTISYRQRLPPYTWSSILLTSKLLLSLREGELIHYFDGSSDHRRKIPHQMHDRGVDFRKFIEVDGHLVWPCTKESSSVICSKFARIRRLRLPSLVQAVAPATGSRFFVLCENALAQCELDSLEPIWVVEDPMVTV